MAKRSEKINKKDLEHDEVLEFTDHALFWLKEHANQILTVITLVFVGYAIFVFFHSRKEAELRVASNDFYSAVQDFDRNLGQNQWATAERTSGMRQVVEKADAILQEYGDTEIARNALFLKGNAYYFAGDPLGQTENTEEAISVFEEYLQQARQMGDGFEQGAALLALGYAHENLFILTMSQNEEAARQSLTAAADYYDQIQELPDTGFLQYEALNAKARLLKYLGRREEARELYEQVVRESYDQIEQPGPDAPRREQIMALVRTYANQFTTGRTALLELQRMGVDTEELLADAGLE